ncbi:MAG: haloacetate dehalogenase [Conexibacter sp.]|nr:haloacetate dehalogenase [Conexibacter sp.]
MTLFDGFTAHDLRTPRGPVHALVGGDGPPLLLLHGYPQSLAMWRTTAPLLSARHTVVVADLAGYGASVRPSPTPDHAAHSKRAMARDQIEAMAALGFDRFAVAGHDRGGRVAYRMALDHPERVERLAVLDIVPTSDVYRQRARDFARGYWHWAFLAQPAPLPERLIGADPATFFDLHVREGMGLGREPSRYPTDVMAIYRSALDDPGAVRAMCEDYRAGASIDVDLDEADRRQRRRITCPVLVLWAAHGSLPKTYRDVLEVWRHWAPDATGSAIDAAHFLAEDRPEEVAAALLAFTSQTSTVASPPLTPS